MLKLLDDATRETIDALGEVRARQADLQSREEFLKKSLVRKLGKNSVGEGFRFRVTITTSDCWTLDMNAVRAKLTPQFITANSKRSTRTVVKTVSRNNRRKKDSAKK